MCEKNTKLATMKISVDDNRAVRGHNNMVEQK